MHSPSKHFSGFHFQREHQDSVEKNADTILVIHDIATSSHRKLLFWAMAGIIPVIAVVSIITSQNVTTALMLVLVLLSSDAFMARRTSTEINLADRMIRMRCGVYALAWHRVYSLDDYATAEIKGKAQVIEGYSLPFFSVYLVGTGRHIKIYSTDDADDATAVYGAITGFLNDAGISIQKQWAE